MPNEPIRPTGGDPRHSFTFGLVLAVARTLEAHGYPPITDGRELVELQTHLWCFLHGDGGPCSGRARGDHWQDHLDATASDGGDR